MDTLRITWETWENDYHTQANCRMKTSLDKMNPRGQLDSTRRKHSDKTPTTRWKRTPNLEDACKGKPD